MSADREAGLVVLAIQNGKARCTLSLPLSAASTVATVLRQLSSEEDDVHTHTFEVRGDLEP